MNELFKKEEERIGKPIRDFITNRLTNGFKNIKGREILRVEGSPLLDMHINEKESEIKDLIVIDSVSANVRVWVKFSDGESNDYVAISINKSFRLTYDFQVKEYQIENKENIVIIDNSRY